MMNPAMDAPQRNRRARPLEPPGRGPRPDAQHPRSTSCAAARYHASRGGQCKRFHRTPRPGRTDSEPSPREDTGAPVGGRIESGWTTRQQGGSGESAGWNRPSRGWNHPAGRWNPRDNRVEPAGMQGWKVGWPARSTRPGGSDPPAGSLDSPDNRVEAPGRRVVRGVEEARSGRPVTLERPAMGFTPAAAGTESKGGHLGTVSHQGRAWGQKG